MSAEIITYPKRAIAPIANVRSGFYYSIYSALHFPIIYELQRQDYQISGVSTKTSPYPSKKILVVNLPAPVNSPDSITVGDQIYLRSGNYDMIIQVINVYSATQFSFVPISANYTSNPLVNSIGGFINLNSVRKNYYLEIDVLSANSNIYYILGNIQNRTDSRGIVRLDVQPFIKGLEGYDNTFLYNVINKADLLSSNLFNIRYNERWDNSPNIPMGIAPITATSMMYFVNAAKQLLDKFGQNMGEYVPFLSTNNPADNPIAKFLNGYTPTYFVGFPMDLSFIYSNEISGNTIKRNVDYINNNPANNTSAAIVTLAVSERFYVNRLTLPIPPAGTRYMNVYLQLDNVETPLSTSYINVAYFHVPGVQHIRSASRNDPYTPPYP